MIDGLFRDVFLAEAYRFVGRSLARRYPHAFIRVYQGVHVRARARARENKLIYNQILIA